MTPYSGSVHVFLGALADAGYGGAPKPVGIDKDGRERLVFIDKASSTASSSTTGCCTAGFRNNFHVSCLGAVDETKRIEVEYCP